ncbi:MAG TPA: hypothetical protein VF680_17170 [Allosphingosinicella sp.]|jgi:hypothetical protein
MAVKKQITMFRPMVVSRHPSHNCLKFSSKNLPLSKIRSVVRFGSTTEVQDTIANGGRRVEINTVQAVKNSANKLLMKRCFEASGVRTAIWVQGGANFEAELAAKMEGGQLQFPIVAKAHYGSKGKGNTLIKSQAELDAWKVDKTLANYIFEKFMNYAHEFRLHITEDGCFYACRKALRKDTPEEEKWHFHDSTCVWFLEENESFFKPNSWSDIEKDCVKALKSVGADVLSFDVKVQSPVDGKGKKREYQDYILLECNSASSMDNGTGELSVCARKYIEMIPKLINKKANL